MNANIKDIIFSYFITSYGILYEMAPYLLLGFIIAGILKLIIPQEKVFKHLSGNSIKSILKASFIGVPLPLCSCSIIPVSAHLKKQGAGDAPTISFLTSAPSTGIDSFLATYALLGPIFALLRLIASFISGIFAGIMIKIFLKQTKAGYHAVSENFRNQSLSNKIVLSIKYSFYELPKNISKWLLIGIALGGLINFLLPKESVETFFSKKYSGYILMLVVSLPLYICATGSIPIAASLILKGISPGTALIFLIAGPATNTATISFIIGNMGKKALFIYLSSIIFTAITFAFVADNIFQLTNSQITIIHPDMLSPQLKHVSASIILLLSIFLLIKNKFQKQKKCSHCNEH